jgi:hypothetical protein
MFFDRQMECDAIMADREREAELVLLRSEARQGRMIDEKPRSVGRAVPQWLKRPPFALRFTHR